MTNRNPTITVQKVENGYLVQTREKTWVSASLSEYSLASVLSEAFTQAELESVHTDAPLTLDRWSITNASDEIPY